MSSVPLDLEENIYNLKKQKQVISPYGTHVILRLFNDNRYTINVYKYSVQGWFANELFQEKPRKLCLMHTIRIYMWILQIMIW